MLPRNSMMASVLSTTIRQTAVGDFASTRPTQLSQKGKIAGIKRPPLQGGGGEHSHEFSDVRAEATKITPARIYQGQGQ